MTKPPSPGIERRGHPRLTLDLICHVQSRALKHWKASGRTVNISRSGVLLRLERAVVTDAPPLLGSRLCLDIELPTRRLLRCHGRLVRMTESRRDGALLAVAIERMEFREQARKPVRAAQKPRCGEVRELLM